MTDVYANLLDHHLGGSDFTAAFNDALLTKKNVFVPPGTYDISSAITLDSGRTLIGAGRGVSIVRMVAGSPGASAFVIPHRANLVNIYSLTIMRESSEGVTGNGISQADGHSCDLVTMRDVELRNHYNGAQLGMTGYSVIQSVLSHHNRNHGFIFNSAGKIDPKDKGGPVQWYLSQCNSGNNGGGGFVYFASGTSGENAMGSLTDCETYNNKKWGVAVLGNPASIFSGMRIDGGFFGEDLWDEIHFDSYGRLHTISPKCVELAGQDKGGTACGINISPNNSSVTISVGHAFNNNGDGIYVGGGDVTINGGFMSGNGAGGVQRSGINVAGGRATITGVRATGQLNGITANAQTLIVGCDLQGNSGASISGSPAVNTGNRT